MKIKEISSLTTNSVNETKIIEIPSLTINSDKKNASFISVDSSTASVSSLSESSMVGQKRCHSPEKIVKRKQAKITNLFKKQSFKD